MGKYWFAVVKWLRNAKNKYNWMFSGLKLVTYLFASPGYPSEAMSDWIGSSCMYLLLAVLLLLPNRVREVIGFIYQSVIIMRCLFIQSIINKKLPTKLVRKR